MMNPTLAVPQHIQAKNWFREIAIVLGASGLIALSGLLSIPLPFTPVPIVLQCHVILFLAAFLGSKRGTLAVTAFLVQVALGLPALSGGRGGIHVFAGPTGGYLIGWIVGAYLTGLIVEKLKIRSPANTFSAIALGNLAIYAFGYVHLANFLGFQKAFYLGILPFIVGDLFKSFLCVRSLKALRFFTNEV
jgi:biotin transport system substrate-specific component